MATDARGYYEVAAVAAGKHVVTLESPPLPAAYTFEGSETVAVEVERKSPAQSGFSLL